MLVLLVWSKSTNVYSFSCWVVSKRWLTNFYSFRYQRVSKGWVDLPTVGLIFEKPMFTSSPIGYQVNVGKPMFTAPDSTDK